MPAGTGFTRDPRGEVVFTLDDAVTVLPVRSLTLQAGGQDRTADLRPAVASTCCPPAAAPARPVISLDLATGGLGRAPSRC